MTIRLALVKVPQKIHSTLKAHSSTSEFRGDGLRDAAGRPRGEALRGVGDPPSRLRLSGLSPFTGEFLRGEKLLRGSRLRRGERLSLDRLLLRRSSS